MAHARARVVFLGGNGHSASRLAAVRETIRSLPDPFDLVDVPYPGFEGRPRAATVNEFLDAIQPHLVGTLLYATGIGGLFALAIRARGELRELPILMQAPVLWGLERRWFPWLMRRGLWRLFPLILRSRRFQRRFARTKFTHPPTDQTLAAFFAGYQACSATTDFFHWLTPTFLRQLERELANVPGCLDRISFWWGGQDTVVSTEELRITEKALRRTWPLHVVPHWGHYPMIDAPDEWVRGLIDVLAATA